MHRIRLRGHHLLCLLGYRGMGYSPSFCDNMTLIYETLRKSPETEVELMEGPDVICQAYPAEETPHCEGREVSRRDAQVLEKLGVTIGEVFRWSEMLEKIAEELVPEDIGRLCETCPWQPYGVCEEGVRLIRQGHQLPSIAG